MRRIPTAHMDTEDETDEINQRNLQRYDRAYNDMSQIKTYHDISMSTGFIFVQKDFLMRLRSCSLNLLQR